MNRTDWHEKVKEISWDKPTMAWVFKNKFPFVKAINHLFNSFIDARIDQGIDPDKLDLILNSFIEKVEFFLWDDQIQAIVEWQGTNNFRGEFDIWSAVFDISGNMIGE